MKIDRLLEIVIYLLNHETASAKVLAQRFQVSVRTIQRDMISISAAGIPLYSAGGRSGGYGILPSYRLKNSEIREEEQQMIKKALESLSTSYTNTALSTVIEKYHAITGKENSANIFWDFGVTKENKSVQNILYVLERAIQEKRCVNFVYSNAEGRLSHPRVEPLAVYYKWYAWYLFGYSPERDGYRTYKLARMRDLVSEKTGFHREHGNVSALLQDSERAYYATCIPVELCFEEEGRSLVEEYFADCPIQKSGETGYTATLHVPPKERLWKALLLSFGGRVRVIAPKEYREELAASARNFLLNCDSQVSRS